MAKGIARRMPLPFLRHVLLFETVCALRFGAHQNIRDEHPIFFEFFFFFFKNKKKKSSFFFFFVFGSLRTIEILLEIVQTMLES